MEKDVILFGIQGSGKGTQASQLMEGFPGLYSYFATGQLFRALIGTDNAIGKYVKERIERGDLINDRVTVALFNAYVQTVIDDGKQMLLDGFPRTLHQMKRTMEIINANDREIIGIQLVLPDEVAIQRMEERGREDDTPESMQHRINQFYDKTQPMINWFADQEKLVKVKADRPIEEVAKDIRGVLGK